MKVRANIFLRVLVVATACVAMGWSQALPADIKAKAEAKISEIKAWSTDPQVVAAVQAYKTAPPAEAKGMTNDKWKELTVLDPLVR